MDLLEIELHERRVFIAIADVNKSKRYIVEQKKASSQSAGARHYGCCAGEKCRRRTGSELFERKQPKYTRPEKFDLNWSWRSQMPVLRIS